MISDESDVLVFIARQLVKSLEARTRVRYQTADVIKWARQQATAHPNINHSPVWWMQSAIEDLECLDSCHAMLREARGYAS